MHNENNNQPDQTTQTSEPLHWNPRSKGDAVVGTLIRTKNVKVNGKRTLAAIIREEDGCEWSVLLFHKVLKERWKELNPRSGKHVEITYLGERESWRGRYYKHFDLTVR